MRNGENRRAMRVLLVSANREQINMRTLPLGMGCVAATARRGGHEVKVVDLLAEGADSSSFRLALESWNPGVIGVSIRNVDDQSMQDTRFLLEGVRDVIADCRAFSEAPVVLGGAGYSIFPESILDFLEADMGIQGEGEAAFPALLERLEAGAALEGTPGLYLPGRGLQGARAFETELDRLPLPEPGLWIPADLPRTDTWIPIQTRRGCPMRCSYCSTATIEGRRIRKRSPETSVRWMAEHVRAGFRRFHFVDNTFNLPGDYAREICRTLVKERLDVCWRCIVYPGKLDRSLVNDMAGAGCAEVSLGFESGCDRILRAMNKGFGTGDVARLSKALAGRGVRQMGFLLLGGPGETRESVEESLAFADSLPLDMVKVTAGIRIYPGTALARSAVEDGILRPEEDLLVPRFYVVPALRDWLQEAVKRWVEERPHWVT